MNRLISHVKILIYTVEVSQSLISIHGIDHSEDMTKKACITCCKIYSVQVGLHIADVGHMSLSFRPVECSPTTTISDDRPIIRYIPYSVTLVYMMKIQVGVVQLLTSEAKNNLSRVCWILVHM